MNRKKLVKDIQTLLMPPVNDMGYDVLGVELGGSGRMTLRIFIDTPGGVTVGDCARISREASDLLDIANIMPGPYLLEVSSPGLERPIKSPEDWRRSMGRKARIVCHRAIHGKQVWTGRVVDSSDDYVVIDVEGRELSLNIADIARARLEIEL